MRFEDLTEEQKKFVDRYFEENVYPVLTPMAVDASRPFPLIRNKTLNIARTVFLKRIQRAKNRNWILQRYRFRGSFRDWYRSRQRKKRHKRFILLEQIIEKNIDKLFLNYKVLCAHPYRIMRNADLTIDEDEAADLLKEIQKQLKMRQWGEVIRLEVEEWHGQTPAEVSESTS